MISRLTPADAMVQQMRASPCTTRRVGFYARQIKALSEGVIAMQRRWLRNLGAA